MTIDQVLEKAFTSGDLANGGLLNPEQAARFVQGIFENSVVNVEARREPMKATKKQIDKITYSGNVLQKPVAVGTEHTTTTSPDTSKVVLDAKEVIVAIDLGYDALEDSIENGTLFNTVMDLTSRKVGLELDTLVLHGDTAGGTGTFLDVIDGIFKQITTNVYDASVAPLDKDVLGGALKKLPGQYFQNESELRYYVSHLARLNYNEYLASIVVNDAFSQYLVGQKEPSYSGVPVRKVGGILTEALAGPFPGSKALLINPKNIVVGVHRDIMFETERKPRKRVVEVTMTMRLDAKLEREDAAVKITNIKHAV